MLLTIVAIWTIIIPLAVLAISWEGANRREERAAQARSRSLEKPRPAGVPQCAGRAARPGRSRARRVCPERPRAARSRRASA